MFERTIKPKRVLEPQERISEVLFGLIMVLTFTGSLSVAEAGREDVRTILIGALGCNIAWGIIYVVQYLMDCFAEKGRNLMTFQAMRKTRDLNRAHQLISDALPPLVATVLDFDDLESIRMRLLQLPEQPNYVRLSKQDWLGAFGVFLLVFFSTFPVAVPFIFMDNATSAMRVSNLIAMAMLFVAGFFYGRCISRSPWIFGIGMILLGGALVALTIAFGG